MKKPEINKNSKQAIENCFGKTVSGISRIQNFFNNIEDRDGLGDLLIHFDTDCFLRLQNYGDAESIMAENSQGEVPESFYVFEEDFISFKLINMNDNNDWKKLMGQKLLQANIEWLKHPDNSKSLIAVVLYFDKDYISFYHGNSDSTEFYVNKPLPKMNATIQTETRMYKP
jgi:hypothetical protein